jgi:hypothetical protein
LIVILTTTGRKNLSGGPCIFAEILHFAPLVQNDDTPETFGKETFGKMY